MKINNLKSDIEKISNEIFDDVVSFRKWIHKHPELSFQEKETSEFICSILKKNDIRFTKNIGGYGIVAVIEGKKSSSRVIGFRADMDALPIIEENDIDYKSVNHGIMHACGHDVHSSILLGVAIIVNKLKENLIGTIKFIFQPAEEKLPGGASLMIKSGVLKNPDVEKMLALHVFPEMEVGNVGFKSGQYMAACDDMKIEIIGRGGHAALINKTINPITVASELIINTKQKVENRKNSSPYVLEFGDFRAFGASNVIPEKALVEGTLRTMDEDFRQEVHEILKSEAIKIENKYKAKCNFNIIKGYPCLFNNEKVTEKCINLSRDILDENSIHEIPIRMASEDFSFFSQKCPSTFFRLGVANSEKGIIHSVHTSKFNVDHNSIKIGLNLMSYFAFKV